jgi:hypothetical protein
MKFLCGEAALFNVAFELAFDGAKNPLIITGRRPAKKVLSALKDILQNSERNIPLQKGFEKQSTDTDLIIAVGGQAILNGVKNNGLPIYFIPTVLVDEIYEIPACVSLVVCDTKLFSGNPEKLLTSIGNA